jgi:O-antigen ligase
MNQPEAIKTPEEAGKLISAYGDQLRNGIWPRSTVLWMAAFYMALFIIRPWEVLFPSWEVFHPERSYAICMLTAVFFAKEKYFQMTWQTVTVLIFFAAITTCSLFAIDSSLAWDPFYQYLSLVIFFFVLILIIRTPYELNFIVLSYVAIMFVYLAKALWEFFVNGQHRYDMGVIRLEGIENTFRGPNDLAMSIVVSLPFAVFLWKNRASIAETWPASWQIRLKWGLLIYGAMAVTAIILTNSRSGMLGFVVFIAVLMFSGSGFLKKIKYLVAGALVLALIWALMPAENKGRMSTIWSPEEGPSNAQVSAEGRIEGYKAGMAMFRRYPFTGVGVGNFIAYRVPNVDGIALQAHNLEGQLLGEMGLVGCFTFLLMVGATFGNARRIIRYAGNQTNGALLCLSDLARTSRLSLLLLIFLGTFGHNLYRFNWLWIAAFCVLALRFTRERLQVSSIS